jgi:hypothetical protein
MNERKVNFFFPIKRSEFAKLSKKMDHLSIREMYEQMTLNELLKTHSSLVEWYALIKREFMTQFAITDQNRTRRCHSIEEVRALAQQIIEFWESKKPIFHKDQGFEAEEFAKAMVCNHEINDLAKRLPENSFDNPELESDSEDDEKK